MGQIQIAYQVLENATNSINTFQPDEQVEYFGKRGRLAVMLKKDEKALEDLTQSIEIYEALIVPSELPFGLDIDPSVDEIFEMRSKIYEKMGRIEEALEDINKFIPNDYFTLCRIPLRAI